MVQLLVSGSKFCCFTPFSASIVDHHWKIMKLINLNVFFFTFAAALLVQDSVAALSAADRVLGSDLVLPVAICKKIWGNTLVRTPPFWDRKFFGLQIG